MKNLHQTSSSLISLRDHLRRALQGFERDAAIVGVEQAVTT
jgi:hypothetical protein